VIEQPCQDQLDGAVEHGDGRVAVGGVLLEQPAVEIGNLPDALLQKAVAVGAYHIDLVGRVETAEKEQAQAVAVKVFPFARLLVAAVRIPQCAQIVAAPAKGEPALALQEDEKEQPVEKPLRKEPFLFARQPADQRFHLLEDGAIGSKEVTRHRRDVERLVVAVLHDKRRHARQRRRQRSNVEQAQPLGRRAQPLGWAPPSRRG
jgi:hypothetical protein